MGVREIVNEKVDIVKLVSSFGGKMEPHDNYYIGDLSANSHHFAVYPENGTYKCLECGASGDVLDFLTTVVGLEFSQAKDWIGQEFDIPVDALNNVETVIYPAIKRLHLKKPKEQTADVNAVLYIIAKYHLRSDLQLICCKEIVERTEIPLKKIRDKMKKAVIQVFCEEFIDPNGGESADFSLKPMRLP